MFCYLMFQSWFLYAYVYLHNPDFVVISQLYFCGYNASDNSLPELDIRRTNKKQNCSIKARTPIFCVKESICLTLKDVIPPCLILCLDSEL